jgi:hypothetical protein
LLYFKEISSIRLVRFNTIKCIKPTVKKVILLRASRK